MAKHKAPFNGVGGQGCLSWLVALAFIASAFAFVWVQSR